MWEWILVFVCWVMLMFRYICFPIFYVYFMYEDDIYEAKLTQVVAFWCDSAPKRHTVGWCCFSHTVSKVQTIPRETKEKHWEVWTIDIQVHSTLRFLWHMDVKLFVFTSQFFPWNNFYIWLRSGPNPRELHGKIPTTSLSFAGGSAPHSYCFPHTQFAQAWNDNTFDKSNKKLYKSLVAFFKPGPSFLHLKTCWAV